MTVHRRKLKLALFALDGTNHECQISTWNLDPGDQDGERSYTFCPDGEFIDDAEPEPTLSLTYYADWRSGGLSDYLWANRGKTVTAEITHHPDLPDEAVVFTGDVKLKAPPVGGEARTTETQEIELQVSNLTYARQA